jgi:hypothetical protein
MSKSSAEISTMIDVRFRNIEHVAKCFLNETQAINLERDLIGFLLQIETSHQNQIADLNLKIELLTESK